MTGLTQRITCQKEAILNYLKSVETHPTAEEVYSAVRKKLPRVGLGTIYRNLKQMKEKGIILEIHGETNRYDGRVFPHAHFFCNGCGKVYDIFKEFHFQKEAREIGKVKDYRVYFYGICENCAKRSAKLKN